MICKLYNNKSKDNVLHKDITQVGSDLNVLIKDDSSITEPTIILSVDTNSLKFNYVYLYDFRRYYYVTDIVVSQQRIFVSLKVDVLMSFVDEIMLNDVILDRNTEKFNLYQHDDEFTDLVYDDVSCVGAPNDLIDTSNATFILVTSGG